MEQKVKGPEPIKVDYEKFVVRKQLKEYWRADEKVSLVMLGLSNQVPITTGEAPAAKRRAKSQDVLSDTLSPPPSITFR